MEIPTPHEITALITKLMLNNTETSVELKGYCISLSETYTFKNVQGEYLLEYGRNINRNLHSHGLGCELYTATI